MNKEENPKRFDLKERTFVFTQRIRGFMGSFAGKKIPLAQLGDRVARTTPSNWECERRFPIDEQRQILSQTRPTRYLWSFHRTFEQWFGKPSRAQFILVAFEKPLDAQTMNRDATES